MKEFTYVIRDAEGLHARPAGLLVKLAQGLSSSNVLNFIEVSDDYGIVELAVPNSWRYHSIRELDVRNTYHVNIIAVRKAKDADHALDVAPGAEYVLENGDHVVVLGRSEAINLLHEVK